MPLSRPTTPSEPLPDKVEVGFTELESPDMNIPESFKVPYVVTSLFARQLICEFLGTFLVVTLGLGTIAQAKVTDNEAGNVVSIALGWGIAVMLGLHTAGGISGAHLNSMITTSLVLLGVFPAWKAPAFIATQTLASFVAAALVYAIYRPLINTMDADDRETSYTIFATFPHEGVPNGTALLTEIVAAAIFVFCVLALMDKHNRPIGAHATPTAVGVIVVAIAAGFSVNTGLALNPARDFGPRLFMLLAGWGSKVFTLNDYYFWVPIVGPTVGGAIGGFAYVGGILYHHPENPHKPLPEHRF